MSQSLVPLVDLYTSPENGEGIPGEQGELVQTIKPYGVGIDCHSEFIAVCVLVRDHDLLVRRWEKQFSTAWNDMKDAAHWARQLVINHSPEPMLSVEKIEFTIESTGCYHLPVIKAFAGTPAVVNPLLASPSRRKTDRLDARLLAYHSITGLWPKSFLASEEVQEVRVLWRQRETSQRNRTKCSNQINNVILRFGHTIGSVNSVNSSTGRAIIEDLCRGIIPNRDNICPLGIPADVGKMILEMYDLWDFYDKRSKEYEKATFDKIKSLTWELGNGKLMLGKDLIKILKTAPGIGELTASIWLMEIINPRRFPDKRACAAFCGADPSLRVSAGKVTSTMRRGGNKNLHNALLNSAKGLLNKHTEPFGQWGLIIQKRNKKAGYKRASNAIARRLSNALYYMHMHGVDFSYDHYAIAHRIIVPEIPVEDMGFSKRFTSLLAALGLRTSTAVVDAYQRDLASQKGIGLKCLNEVHNWIQIMTKDSRLQGGSWAGRKESTSSKPQEKV